MRPVIGVIFVTIMINMYAQEYKLPPKTDKQQVCSIESIKKKYEKNLFNLEHLFFPARNPKRLYIVFNGAPKNRYMMWSWFYDDERWTDTSFLFLKDDTTSWYIGEDGSLVKSYINLINHYMKLSRLTHKQLFTIGSSMGGYAALLYGIMLEVNGVFSFRPQIDYANAASFFLVEKLRHHWIDLNNLVKKYKNLPKMYLQCGMFENDKAAMNTFIDTLKNHSTVIIFHKTTETTHMGFTPSKDFIKKTLKFLESINTNGIVH